LSLPVSGDVAPFDKGKDGGGEVIFTVARYHMPRAADIDVIE
jgi:hypothetical protein